MRLASMISKVFLVVLLVLGVFASAQTTEQAKFGGTATVALTTSPRSADPYWGTDVGNRLLAAHIYESLFTFNETYEVIPQVADTWETSEDKCQWIIHLRTGIKFHNGEELTAEDVKASFDRFLAMSARKSELNYVSSVEATDRYVVVITTETPVATLLMDIANPATLLGIMPEDIAVSNMDDELQPEEVIGTGPYKLVQYEPDMQVTLERFDNYLPDTRFQERTGLGGMKVAYFDEIHFLPVPEAGTRIAGLETGDFSVVMAAPVTAYRLIQENSETEPSIVKPKWGITLQLNHTAWPMSELKFRQAVMAALNMEQILQIVAEGNDTFYRLQPSIWHPEQAAYHNLGGVEGYYDQRDPEKAKRLLEEIGYNGEEIVILSNRDYDAMYKTTLAIVPQLRAVGINARAEFYDWPITVDLARKPGPDWHVFQSLWSARLTPAAVVPLVACGAINVVGYCNPQLDELFAEFSQTFDEDARYEIVTQIQKTIYDDVAVFRIGDVFELEAYQANIHNYKSWYVVPRMWNVWAQD